MKRLSFAAMLVLCGCPQPSSTTGSSGGSSGVATVSSSSAQDVSSSSRAGSSSSSRAPSSGTVSSSLGDSSSQGVSSSGNGCVPTGVETCDGADNNCDGVTDEGFDLTSPATCGSCANDCYAALRNFERASVTCSPAGTCGGTCAQGWHDADNDGASCETFCLPLALDDATCDAFDDDCDGQTDEDVDLCTARDCGGCGWECSAARGTVECQNPSGGACTADTATCVVTSCPCNGPGDCWFDADGAGSNGCEYLCDVTNGGTERCDGVDNDCDGRIDEDISGDAALGVTCFGDPDGECALPQHAGITACVEGSVVCTGNALLREGELAETCNNADDDCDGITDDSPGDVGTPCGVSATGRCRMGTMACEAGMLRCSGNVDPTTETCNGLDDDCDGVTDMTGTTPPADSVGPCDVPLPPPPGATSACRAGMKACVDGRVTCEGSVGPSGSSDACGVDSNCDGALTSQPDRMIDVANCGMCGNDCRTGSVHAFWGCVNGGCQFQGCQPGYYDFDGDRKCSDACIFTSPQELCNGLDDDCDGQTDEDLVAPSPTQVCGVSPNAARPECTTGVMVTCTSGAWRCGFPTGVCNPTCATAVEVCDGVDNNCNGLLNENVMSFGQACASDDGAPGTQGACRTTGTIVCSGPNSAVCSATRADCAAQPGGCTELCDGLDNDCDGATDEVDLQPGSNATNFVKPVVTKIAASTWMMSYEASRANSSPVTSGTGNGYTMVQSGTVPQGTRVCSAGNRMPWFGVTATEADEACIGAGGRLCTLGDWQSACQVTSSCTYGYNPRGAACTSTYSPTKFCNLGPSYDADLAAMGDQDLLEVTGSATLSNCWADWSNLQNNVAATNKIFDVTGNLRELVRTPTGYALMGGSYLSAVEAGAACQFTTYEVGPSFSFNDVGFRCCFTQDPTVP